MLVALVASLAPSVAGASIGQEPAQVDSDVRARLVNPEVIRLGTGETSTKLNAGRDYIVKLPADIKTGYTQITGGRNVLIDGGSIVMDGAGSDLQRRAIYVKDVQGTVRIQNLVISGKHNGAAFDAVAISAPEAVVELVNLTVHNLHGTYSGYHGDIVQPFGGVKKLVVNGLAGRTSYQGFYLAETWGEIGAVELKNVSLSYHENPEDYSTVLLWFDSCSTYPVLLDNVYIQPRSGQTMRESVRPDERTCKPTESGSTLSWPGSAITGSIKLGAADGAPDLPDGPAGPFQPPVADTGASQVRLKAPKRVKAGARAKLTALVNDPDGVSTVAFAVCKGQRCGWGAATKLGVTSGKPHTKVWKAPRRGTFTILVRVTDRNGNVSVKAVKRITVTANTTSSKVKPNARVKPQASGGRTGPAKRK